MRTSMAWLFALAAAVPVEARVVSGRVVDADGRPIEGVAITQGQTPELALREKSAAKTDREGWFRVELPPDEPRTFAARPGGPRSAEKLREEVAEIRAFAATELSARELESRVPVRRRPEILPRLVIAAELIIGSTLLGIR